MFVLFDTWASSSLSACQPDYLLAVAAAAATEATLIRAGCVLTGDTQFTVTQTTKTSAPQHVACVTNSDRGQWLA